MAYVRTYPDCPAVVDVTRPPYSARGDGRTDDTLALQKALNENVGHHRILYFPTGTYLISRTLTWPKRYGNHENWGFTTLQGANPESCILRLADATFTDPQRPQAIMSCGGFGSADWFHNHIHGLTFHVGFRNPGAIGIAFYANNYGALRDCVITSGDGTGRIGLELGHADMNGPLLVRNLTVQGFQIGVHTGHSVNSQTFENLTLSGQTEHGFVNEGQTISIRKLRYNGPATAVSSYGNFLLIEAQLSGQGPASQLPAIVNFNGGKMFLRDIQTSGYRRILGNIPSPDYAAALRLPSEPQKKLTEYATTAATHLFPSPSVSLRLPIKETPDVPWDPPATWAIVDSFGADPEAKKDSTAAIQKAIDSGATTVFFPGFYRISATIHVRGKVRRLLGVGAHLDYEGKVTPDFRVGNGSAPLVIFEHFANLGGGVELATARTVVFRSIGLKTVFSKQNGDIFFEDVTTNSIHLRRQRVWARQLNIENEGTHLTNEGGSLWILGYKTERGGTLLETRQGGKSELLGGISYTTTAGKLAPMLVNDNSDVFTYFHEICYNGDPYTTLVRETRGRETRLIRRGDGEVSPYSGRSQKR